jgi:hypothetical protein
VTKIMAGVLFLALGLGFCDSPVALADASSAQDANHTTSPAKERKAYLKQQKKQQKKTRKAQQKAEKKWKKDHKTGT